LSDSVLQAVQTMKNIPLVSVFLITYNQEDFIESAIQSVLDQDYENLEIVIGDDCSTDNTWRVVQEYQKKFPEKIIAFRNQRTLGITGNSNEVLRRCRGKYIAYLGGDDLFLPGKITAQAAVMEGDPNIVLCYHDVEVFNSEDNRTLRYWNQGPHSAKPIVGLASHVAIELVAKGTFMAAVSVMVRRDAIPSSGYDSRIPVASDWLMWIEVLAGAPAGSRVEFIPQVLARYRRHDANVTLTALKWSADPLVTLAIAEDRYPYLMAAAEKMRPFLRYARGVRFILEGERFLGRQCLLHSLRAGGGSWKCFYWIAASFIPGLLRIRHRK